MTVWKVKQLKQAIVDDGARCLRSSLIVVSMSRYVLQYWLIVSRILKELSLSLSLEWYVFSPACLHNCTSRYRFNKRWSYWLVTDISLCIKQHPLLVAREELPTVQLFLLTMLGHSACGRVGVYTREVVWWRIIVMDGVKEFEFIWTLR